MPFGDFIRNKREEKKIQMNDFARQLEISPAYWSRIERNMEKPPKDELIRKAAEILGIDPDDAFVEASRLPPDMRDDVASEPDQRAANQRSAPAVEDGLFLVPRVIE